MPDYRDMVNQIVEVAGEALTERECEAAASFLEWEGDYTEAQEAFIDSLYAKVCRYEERGAK